MRNIGRSKLNIFLYHFMITLFFFFLVYPLIWLFFSSFKESTDVFKEGYRLIPKVWKFANYTNGWKGFAGITFFTFFKNSFVICTLATVGAMVSSSVIAFGFARLNFKFKKFWFTCMILTMLLPVQVVMIPQFILFNKLNWLNTILPLVVPNFFGAAFFIFLNMQFIQGIPRELDEAAKIDGCSVYQIYSKVVLPLTIPAFVTTGIFAFMWKWDDFFGSLLYLNNPHTYPVNLGLKMFSDPGSLSDYGAMFAMSVLSLIPIFIIFIVCQKYIVEGIATTGLKG